MISTTSIAPPNSLLLIAAAPTTSVPLDDADRPSIVCTSSCIAVPCVAFMDGITSIALGPAFDVDDRPAFEGWLDTPCHRMAVWTMEWEKLIEMSVPTTRAEVRIWANDPSEPDDLYIGVGPPIADRSSIQNPLSVAPNLQHCAHRWGYSAFECAEINRIGRESGCAFCGSKEPHTKSGNFILDRQPNDVINPFLKGPQDLYPICRHCSFRQGLWLSRWQVQHNLCKTA